MSDAPDGNADSTGRLHSEASLDSFSRLFPNAPRSEFRPDVLAALGEAMACAPAAGFGHGTLPAGYTYFGQFLVHDVTDLARADDRPNGRPVPIEQLKQRRTPALDLDSVYGGGFDDPRIGLDQKEGRFRLGSSVEGSVFARADSDLLRDAAGHSRIPDRRNDENLLLSQFHLQFLKLHNALVDRTDDQLPTRDRFDQARQELTRHYHHLVVHDFLKRVLDKKVWRYVFKDRHGQRLWEPDSINLGTIPVEFSMAAMRFGHTMVQNSYVLRPTREDPPLRTPVGGVVAPESVRITLADMFYWSGFRGLQREQGLPDRLVVPWSSFFHYPDPVNNEMTNTARLIVPWPRLFRNEDNLNAFLATDNLLRGNEASLPSGQALVRCVLTEYPQLAKAIELRSLTPCEINAKPSPGKARLLDYAVQRGMKKRVKRQLQRQTPLFAYVLLEAFSVHQGKRLGQLGSLIVGETIRGLIEATPGGTVRKHFSELVEPARKKWKIGDVFSKL